MLAPQDTGEGEETTLPGAAGRNTGLPAATLILFLGLYICIVLDPLFCNLLQQQKESHTRRHAENDLKVVFCA